MPEHAVELVEVALVLHQRRARQIVEILDPARGEVLIHRLHQRKIFAQRDRQAGAFEFGEEFDEHPARIRPIGRGGQAPMRHGVVAIPPGMLGWHGEDTMTRTIAALFCWLACTLPVLAQADYPARPVRIVIGFSPGSVADTPARLLAQKFSQKLGQQFIVENKPGAGSNIAAELVSRAEKDGYTLLMATAAQTINATISKNLTFDFAKDFVPIALVASVPNLLVAHPSLGVDNVRDLIALAKKQTGRNHLWLIGDWHHDPSRRRVDQRHGRREADACSLPRQRAVDHRRAHRAHPASVRAGGARDAVCEQGRSEGAGGDSAKRSSAAPNVPTMSEAGLPGFDIGLWFGLVAPAGTPRAVIDKIAAATAEALQAQDLVSALTAAGLDPNHRRRTGGIRPLYRERDHQGCDCCEGRGPGELGIRPAIQRRAWLQTGTTSAAPPHRSRFRSGWSSRRRHARRTNRGLRADASPVGDYRRATPPACCAA